MTMPKRNVLKDDKENSYYHIYTSGHGNQRIFKDDSDYEYFLSLFHRYLSLAPQKDKYGKLYPHMRGSVELLCYNLLPSYIHLLLFQKDKTAMTELIRSVMTSYSMYFNKKYSRSGALFASRYQASRIESVDTLVNISQYIFRASKDWQGYPYSSIHAYFGIGHPEWLQEEKLLQAVGSLPIYADFLDDINYFKKHKKILKDKLANAQ